MDTSLGRPPADAGRGGRQTDLSGLVALVTGGASGMGLAHARLMAARGARVAITDVSGLALEEARALIAGEGGVALPLIADNQSVGNARRAVADAERAFGRIDILVNNAGISGKSRPIEAIDETGFDRMFGTHVKGAFFFAQAVVPGMKERRFGRIINISSNFVLSGSRGASHYTAAKAALHGLTRAWAVELAPWGITANTVTPGLVETPLTLDSLGADEVARQAALFPLGRIATAQEVAYAVAWLASPEADMMTGQVVSPNGGISIVGI
ncbi:3-oxoacyl-[acyl-carrier protein] reductase [Azospirillum fermentarium]|uniref:SDR family NAD(P)-dependent oxidoreductase n=1 Tax=Azospirillum fermentarium TaxID=1233114 RepID=UPI0022279E12|nr:SDR family NAD(P)-dependent oxidoreductase [Azospirillum fermentarium]MCW2249460.1 3-oxoacyl-[acyl-carrier protein] reductase [Azospirillum fermentarium]